LKSAGDDIKGFPYYRPDLFTSQPFPRDQDIRHHPGNFVAAKSKAPSRPPFPVSILTGKISGVKAVMFALVRLSSMMAMDLPLLDKARTAGPAPTASSCSYTAVVFFFLPQGQI